MTPNVKMIRKLDYIKDGETRQTIIGHLCDMWEADTMKGKLDYSQEYCDYNLIGTAAKKSIRAILPKAYHNSSTPQTIAKMLKRLDVTNVSGEYYLISDEIKKDLYSYVAGFIDSDGFITMDPSLSPRVGMVATGKRGKAFFQELEKEMSIGRLHLDQKVGENNRSQHRLNFYSQGDITALLDKCIPHLRMKKKQGMLLQEAIRIKKNYKKEPWAKERQEQIFKLIKWENWKDARNKWEFDKYNINENDINKYKENCKMSTMDELDSIIKVE
mgnify:CR=1 FL=1